MKPHPGERLRLEGLEKLSRTGRLLVAVSGGRDSVALLHALVAGGFTKLVVCHLDHGLRGRASSGDARFVRALAGRWNLEVEIGKADVARLAAESGQSIETAAREARYRFLAEIANRRRCRTVLLAHHAGDQVETFLFNLFRGAGRAGLGGMSPDSARTIVLPATGGKRRAVELRLVRPMLGIWREQIDRYIAAHRLRYREDASNASLEPTRNRIRHELLPLAEQLFGRDIRAAIWRNAEILRAEEEWLSTLAAPEAGETLEVPRLREQPVALQRRRILGWLRLRGVPGIGFYEVETVRSLLEGGTAKVNLPGGWHARRREKKLFLESPKAVQKADQPTR